MADFGSALGFLGQRHPNVLVYVSARWCSICRTIDATVLTSARVRRALRDVPLLEVDLTAMDRQARALMQLFAAEGPPTLFVVDARARAERPGTRLVGAFPEEVLLERLRSFIG
ncbi:MAG TPA: thioredoxin family protein [Ancylobacter sp.]